MTTDSKPETDTGFVFPKWTNLMRYVLLLGLAGAPVYLGVLVGTAASPRTTDTGYQPEQPVPYSHALHAGELGMDCRYCHTSVENAAFASLPTSQTCMNCHATILPESPKLEAVRESYRTGMPIRWVKVHDLPDYVYFNHSAHVTRGVACIECHGRVDAMDVVKTVQPLSMSWCLDCHRNPDAHLRPEQFVTKMDWKPTGAPGESGREIREQKNIRPSEDCITCHR
jgi:menaquinone reductase, multiheme cytochrome c subunit